MEFCETLLVCSFDIVQFSDYFLTLFGNDCTFSERQLLAKAAYHELKVSNVADDAEAERPTQLQRSASVC